MSILHSVHCTVLTNRVNILVWLVKKSLSDGCVQEDGVLAVGGAHAAWYGARVDAEHSRVEVGRPDWRSPRLHLRTGRLSASSADKNIVTVLLTVHSCTYVTVFVMYKASVEYSCRTGRPASGGGARRGTRGPVCACARARTGRTRRPPRSPRRRSGRNRTCAPGPPSQFASPAARSRTRAPPRWASACSWAPSACCVGAPPAEVRHATKLLNSRTNAFETFQDD